MERNDAFFFYLRESEKSVSGQRHPSTLGGFQPQLFKYQATGLPKYPPLEELEFRSLKDFNSFQQEEGPKFHPNRS